jgi:hypothetical protein
MGEALSSPPLKGVMVCFSSIIFGCFDIKQYYNINIALTIRNPAPTLFIVGTIL